MAKAILSIYDGGPIGGFSGVVKVGGKAYRLPGKTVWTQESHNTEPYAEVCSYDTAEEVRAAARRFIRRLAA